MGAQPKRKLHRKYTRRSHLMSKLRTAWNSFTKCPDTGKWKKPHTVSPYTGKYKGKQVVAVNEA
ncbi:50S ribosomal protein L32 [Candidatus Dojkabacteria bacterium]|uniref:Large ribosomal subunit protein bL32 n=1 Tax=Candidatus Dojkabacteria bacterium TaxID=2099670 RepID=A0A955L752_9BACT|nr:50S ribosomal protein L32 [Candidatus Dojkabacteria bacterium]